VSRPIDFLAACLLGPVRDALRYRLSKIGIADEGEKEQ
jgi:hypothetical protein